VRKIEEIYRESGIKYQVRSKQEIQRFFTGLELIEPGVEMLYRWRPDNNEGISRIDSAGITETDVPGWVGVALKP
jgi:hypothetical protein